MRTTTTLIATAAALALLAPTAAMAARPADKPSKPSKPNAHKPSTNPVKRGKWLKWHGTRGDDSYQGRTDGLNMAKGLSGNDTITGGDKHDRIWGGFGSDTLSGGDGPDWLWPGPGQDTTDGGPGNDRIFAASNDHQVDTITCGDGFDRVVARWDDNVADDCERVVRIGKKPASESTEGETSSGDDSTTSTSS